MATCFYCSEEEAWAEGLWLESQEWIQTTVMNICPVQLTLHVDSRYCSLLETNNCSSPSASVCLAPSLPNPFQLSWGSILHHVHSCFPLLQHTRHPVILMHWYVVNRWIWVWHWVEATLFSPCRWLRREGGEEAWTVATLLNCCVALWDKKLSTGDRWNMHNCFWKSPNESVLTCISDCDKSQSLHMVTPVRHKQT